MSNYRTFLSQLGQRESSGNQAAINGFGYLGLYQMGEAALIDADYMQTEDKLCFLKWYKNVAL